MDMHTAEVIIIIVCNQKKITAHEVCPLLTTKARFILSSHVKISN
jgi:hypothetical protein